jgi:iduronate 2-sulfatase
MEYAMSTTGHNRRSFMKCSLGTLGAAVLSPVLHKTAVADSGKKTRNVLLVIVEDLKNIMGCYGNPLVQTPNLDRLAQKGVIFDRAYCQFPVCNPSRSSFLTGLRPDTTQILDNSTALKTHIKDHPTLPQLFKNNGYYTIGLGKVFHGGNKHDDPQAWDVNLDFGQTKLGKRGESRNMTDGKIDWCNWLAAEGTDQDQPDGQIAAKAVEFLKDPHDRPFFMAVGFHKPHDPFHAPKEYFDLYPLNDLMPPVVPGNKTSKEDYMIGSGWHDEMKKFSLQDQREFLRCYYACTTFVDAQIGKVMDELDRQNLWKDTAVMFVGDHGYNLGEYDWWNKAVLMEDSARIPMIAVVHGETKENTRCSQFVEMVDLYPTFADMCGLKTPDNLEGISFRTLLGEPEKPWKKAAYTQVQRGDLAGKSVRTKRWRYNEWTRNNRVLTKELFDHASDPGEYRNLADMEDFKGVCDELSQLLKTGHNVRLGSQ